MKEIKVNIPDGTKKMTIEIQEDGKTVTQYKKPEVKEEKFEPKDGDILFGNFIIRNIIIYKGTNERGAVLSYAGLSSLLGIDELSICDKSHIGFGYTRDYTRYATEAEKQRLFDALAKEGKRWNAETKQIEDLPRWRAQYDGTYYFIGFNFELTEEKEYNNSTDNKRYKMGNYFKTKEAAERVLEQISEIFKKSKAE